MSRSTIGTRLRWRAERQAEAAEARVAELTARVGKLEAALESAQAAMWDSFYGKGLDVAYARKVDDEIRSALSGSPAPTEQQLQETQNRAKAAIAEVEEAARIDPADLKRPVGSPASVEEAEHYREVRDIAELRADLKLPPSKLSGEKIEAERAVVKAAKRAHRFWFWGAAYEDEFKAAIESTMEACDALAKARETGEREAEDVE